MRRAVLFCGTASFLMALLGGVLAFGLVAPSLASAQSSPPQEVRASAFTLVNADGRVQARLWVNPVGAGVLEFMRSDGSVSSTVSVVGLQMRDADGNLYLRVGRCTGLTAPCPGGSYEGLQLGPNGSVSPLP